MKKPSVSIAWNSLIIVLLRENMLKREHSTAWWITTSHIHSHSRCLSLLSIEASRLDQEAATESEEAKGRHEVVKTRWTPLSILQDCWKMTFGAGRSASFENLWSGTFLHGEQNKNTTRSWTRFFSKKSTVFPHTVDGQNPAPPRMMIIPLFIGF